MQRANHCLFWSRPGQLRHKKPLHRHGGNRASEFGNHKGRHNSESPLVNQYYKLDSSTLLTAESQAHNLGKALLKGISEERLIETESTLVETSGLESDEFLSYPVEFMFGAIDWQDDENDTTRSFQRQSYGQTGSFLSRKEYIWTYEFGDHDNPPI